MLGLVALVLSRLRWATPSVKHALWLIVLIKFATPPLVCWPWAFDWTSLEWPSALRVTADPVVVAETPGPAAILDSPAPDGPPAAGSCGSDLAMERLDDSPQALPVAAAQPAPASVTADEAPAAQPTAIAPTVAPEVPAAFWRPALRSTASITRGTLIAWLVVSVTIAMGQAIRIIRFRRRLRDAVPAPDSLIDEAYRIGHWLGVDVPELLVVDQLGTPMLWCLARPQLLLPTRLVKTLPLERLAGHLDPRARASAPARSLGFTARACDRIDLVVEPDLLAHARPARRGS